MDISGTSSASSQQIAPQRNVQNESTLQRQETETQKQTQSVDKVTTEQPVQQPKKLSEDVVNARVSEHQSLASGKQVTADEAVGSLVDVRV